MKFNFNKKTILFVFIIVLFVATSFYFGLMISNFNQNLGNKSAVANLTKEKTLELKNAAFDDKPAYYSYSAFDEKFYGPYDRNDVKYGDYYVKIGIPQGSGGFSILRLFDKNKKLIEINAGEKNACDFGSFLFFKGNIYMENAGELYKIDPELDFACFPLLKDEYEKISVKRILLDDAKDGDNIDVKGYKYFYFDKFVTPNYLNGVQFSPKNNKNIEIKLDFDASNNKHRNVTLNITNVSKD